MRRTKLANVCFASGVANHESPVTTSRGRKTNTIHEITLNYTKWRRLVRVASCDFVDRLLVLFTTFAATCQYSSLITHHSLLFLSEKTFELRLGARVSRKHCLQV